MASQSLFLLNSPFVREQAQAFAQRLLADQTQNIADDQRLATAYFLAFGRPPTSEEQTDARAFLAAYQTDPVNQPRSEADRRLSAWQSYCQLLLCSNEFLYVD